jgi:hypothetical protein
MVMAASVPPTEFSAGRIVFAQLLGRSGHGMRGAAQSSAVLSLRSSLVAGCVVAVILAARIGDPGAYLHADPALARLLRGMAVIKALIATAAAGAVFWRVGLPIAAKYAACYIISVWVMAGSATLIWQLSFLLPAAVLFHIGALSMLLVGWRDRS